jgi:hypothetical protein
VLIGAIAAAVVVVVALVAALLTRRVAHDDAHSVEGYHRSLHTLESINAHPVLPGEQSGPDQRASPGSPASAVRVAGTATVRLTGSGPTSPPVLPAPTPPLADPDRPLTFDDESHDDPTGPPAPRILASAPPELGEKAMVSINHRPRRLAAPATAVAAVLVLVVVLLVTGSHSVTPHGARARGADSGHASASAPKSHGTHKKKRPTTPTTATTAPPAVSAPVSSTLRAATYHVAADDFTMTLAATSGACWVDATDSTTGATLFIGTLEPGQRQTIEATSPVTLEVGAPTVLAASVDGVPAVLPPGLQTPFTMSFVTPAGAPA